MTGLREELLNRGILLTYFVCLVTTTTEGTQNLLFPLYLGQYGYALAAIGTLSSLVGVMRLASRVPSGARYRGSRAKVQQLLWLALFIVTPVLAIVQLVGGGWRSAGRGPLLPVWARAVLWALAVAAGAGATALWISPTGSGPRESSSTPGSTHGSGMTFVIDRS